jgi:hypothetical protein
MRAERRLVAKGQRLAGRGSYRMTDAPGKRERVYSGARLSTATGPARPACESCRATARATSSPTVPPAKPPYKRRLHRLRNLALVITVGASCREHDASNSTYWRCECARGTEVSNLREPANKSACGSRAGQAGECLAVPNPKPTRRYQASAWETGQRVLAATASYALALADRRAWRLERSFRTVLADEPVGDAPVSLPGELAVLVANVCESHVLTVISLGDTDHFDSSIAQKFEPEDKVRVIVSPVLEELVVPAHSVEGSRFDQERRAKTVGVDSGWLGQCRLQRWDFLKLHHLAPPLPEGKVCIARRHVGAYDARQAGRAFELIISVQEEEKVPVGIKRGHIPGLRVVPRVQPRTVCNAEPSAPKHRGGRVQIVSRSKIDDPKRVGMIVLRKQRRKRPAQIV